MKKINAIDQLISVAHIIDDVHNSIKKELLGKCADTLPAGKNQFKAYHDALLFIASHAVDETLREMSASEMERITASLRKNIAKTESLAGSGISGTPVRSSFSFFLLRELFRRYQDGINFYSFDEQGLHPKDVLKDVLPEMEYALLTDDTLNKEKWLQKAAGTKDLHGMLEWLINVVDGFRCSDSIKEQLFDSLKVYVEINPDDKNFSRSFGRIRTNAFFYHKDGIQKKINESEWIHKKLPKETKLSPEQKREIIHASRTALCMLNRETDPVTYCNEDGLMFFELERGLSIALFSMLPERRLPLESYIGFMMFKNGYPMSYGGAWLFAKRALIGINIFEAFRGGESALVFANLLRTYKNAFGADYFEVEPYQFGKHNPEGIRSGAFWFYYRFGFRSLNKELFDLAESEQTKIRSIKNYRTPAETLKKFTESNLFVNFGNKPAIVPDPLKLSKRITETINKEFNGNRSAALRRAHFTLNRLQIKRNRKNLFGYDKLTLFVALCLDHEKLTAERKKILNKLIEQKSVNEFEYIRTLSLLRMETLIND